MNNMKKPVRKLSMSRETIKKLQDGDLAWVVGGSNVKTCLLGATVCGDGSAGCTPKVDG
jgi:hypothetical protein